MHFEFQKELTAAILAGGKSTRFGGSKFMARFDKKNLIEIALEIALQISNRVMVLKGGDEILLPNHMQAFQDKFIDKGPLGGVHSALVNSKTRWIAILPVDMPLLSPIIYKYMAESRDQNRPVIAVSQKGWEPLVSVWPKSAATSIEKFLNENKRSMWYCLKELKAIEVNVAKKYPEIPNECFFNINTKKDLDELKKVYSQIDSYEKDK